MQVHRHKRFTLQTLSPRINPPRRKWRGLEKILGVLVLLGETSPLAILRSQGRVDRGYVELHCGTFLMTFIAFLIGYYKAAQETGSKIVPKFHCGHNSDQSHVQPPNGPIGKSKRRAQGFDIFISIDKLYKKKRLHSLAHKKSYACNFTQVCVATKAGT